MGRGSSRQNFLRDEADRVNQGDSDDSDSSQSFEKIKENELIIAEKIVKIAKRNMMDMLA
jgi:hypothetical protein